MIQKSSFIVPYKGRVPVHENEVPNYKTDIFDGKADFIDAYTWKSKKGTNAKYIDIMTHWDGSETGGAKVCYYTRYCQWLYFV